MAAHVSSPFAGKAAKLDRRRRKAVIILKLVIIASLLSSKVNAEDNMSTKIIVGYFMFVFG
jgi:hypothetical protein